MNPGMNYLQRFYARDILVFTLSIHSNYGPIYFFIINESDS